ncbi:helix-turn-helix domain-containing protein [Nitrospirillum viridazoti]|uniref:AraC family transcriptional regulator n=1 Tax=Nitrospirillum amazonense TaxID=28077 RepID=A0A560HN81_9PROT|nr:AraC family transcriptional regulator [Nitrospirillum amazonense]TWB46969.1 AraC family transcriptional regulator [Nitrospirillum amazonense]
METALIDYATGAPTPHVSYGARFPLGGLTLSRCAFPPNPGITLGSTQAIVAIHSGPAFEMAWKHPERDRLQQSLITDGAMNVNCADLPVFHSWEAVAQALIVAFDKQFLERTCVEAFGDGALALPVLVGVSDPRVQRLGALFSQEVADGGVGGRPYAEGLAIALIVHLVQSYGTAGYKKLHVTGGVAPIPLKRVMDYIEDHLGEEMGLADLAMLTGLSAHHFGQAFKVSTGVSPHRYLIERRIHRAKEMLLNGDRPIAEIAVAVGFASQSHMTINFRRLAGITPARYRQALVGHQRRRSKEDGRND